MIYKTFNHKQKRDLHGMSAAIIRYSGELDKAPTVIAQGKGRLANQIIKHAKEQDIPLQEDTQLIGNLIDMDLGDSIPPQLYSVMAEILLMLEELQKNA